MSLMIQMMVIVQKAKSCWRLRNTGSTPQPPLSTSAPSPLLLLGSVKMIIVPIANVASPDSGKRFASQFCFSLVNWRHFRLFFVF